MSKLPFAQRSSLPTVLHVPKIRSVVTTYMQLVIRCASSAAPGVVDETEETNIVEFAKVSADDFQLNVAAPHDEFQSVALSPMQSLGFALVALCAKDSVWGSI
eukprot:SAG31_NODE_348_length_17296_cov_5.089482_5_plen_103_part_00